MGGGGSKSADIKSDIKNSKNTVSAGGISQPSLVGEGGDQSLADQS